MPDVSGGARLASPHACKTGAAPFNRVDVIPVQVRNELGQVVIEALNGTLEELDDDGTVLTGPTTPTEMSDDTLFQGASSTAAAAAAAAARFWVQLHVTERVVNSAPLDIVEFRTPTALRWHVILSWIQLLLKDEESLKDPDELDRVLDVLNDVDTVQQKQNLIEYGRREFADNPELLDVINTLFAASIDDSKRNQYIEDSKKPSRQDVSCFCFYSLPSS